MPIPGTLGEEKAKEDKIIDESTRIRERERRAKKRGPSLLRTLFGKSEPAQFGPAASIKKLRKARARDLKEGFGDLDLNPKKKYKEMADY